MKTVASVFSRLQTAVGYAGSTSLVIFLGLLFAFPALAQREKIPNFEGTVIAPLLFERDIEEQEALLFIEFTSDSLPTEIVVGFINEDFPLNLQDEVPLHEWPSFIFGKNEDAVAFLLDVPNFPEAIAIEANNFDDAYPRVIMVMIPLDKGFILGALRSTEKRFYDVETLFYSTIRSLEMLD